tara:strand:- start:4600 stop:5181 length:582 start_codon:yes stop_codon:yes gene_type:complete
MKTLKVEEDLTQVIELLANQCIVAIFQGRAESGPRALGNRSILWDPQMPVGRVRVNKLKNRESWRPFAGVIDEESAPHWFDMKGMKSSPFMSYAVKLKDSNNRYMMESILHNDNTCRIQTVSPEQNPTLSKIIKAFNRAVPMHPPMLGNTSFNRAGEPLVHTIDDAINALKSDDFIEYLYLPEEGKILVSPNA